MAVYYWRGAVSSDVNNPANWSLWYSSGATFLPPASTTKPVWGSDLQFVKWNIAGNTSYPLYGPSGTLSGNSASPSSTAGIRYIKSVKVQEDFPINIGVSGLGFSGTTAYLSIYADSISLYHAANTHNYVFLNLQPHPVYSGPAFVNLASKAPGVNYFIKGVGSVSANLTAYPTYSNTYLYDFSGAVQAWSPTSFDKFYFNTTSQIDQDLIFQGQGNEIYLTKGFAIQSEKSMYLRALAPNSTQTLNLLPVGISGDTGPAEYTQTTLKLITEGTNNSWPLILVNHGTDFTNLQMQAGQIQFGPAGPNDSCRIFQGTMNSATSKMIINNSADVTILSPVAGFSGFAVQSASTGTPLPIFYNGNYSIVMNDSSYVWPGGVT